jgi:hypothetical protein
MSKKTPAANPKEAIQVLDQLTDCIEKNPGAIKALETSAIKSQVKTNAKQAKQLAEFKECLLWAHTQAAAWFAFSVGRFDKQGKKEYRAMMKRCEKLLK